jgi:hypothetical protein
LNFKSYKKFITFDTGLDGGRLYRETAAFMEKNYFVVEYNFILGCSKTPNNGSKIVKMELNSLLLGTTMYWWD